MSYLIIILHTFLCWYFEGQRVKIRLSNHLCILVVGLYELIAQAYWPICAGNSKYTMHLLECNVQSFIESFVGRINFYLFFVFIIYCGLAVHSDEIKINI